MNEDLSTAQSALIGRLAMHIYNNSKPAGEVAGIKLRVSNPGSLPKGIVGAMIDPVNPWGAVFLVDRDRTA
jgi:hypothetical protein